jgi:hypothetical protein
VVTVTCICLRLEGERKGNAVDQATNEEWDVSMAALPKIRSWKFNLGVLYYLMINTYVPYKHTWRERSGFLVQEMRDIHEYEKDLHVVAYYFEVSTICLQKLARLLKIHLIPLLCVL